MKNLNEHEIEVAMKIHELYDKFMEDLLDVLDGEDPAYIIAILITISAEIVEVTKGTKQSQSKEEFKKKLVEEIFGKTP